MNKQANSEEALTKRVHEKTYPHDLELALALGNELAKPANGGVIAILQGFATIAKAAQASTEDGAKLTK